MSSITNLVKLKNFLLILEEVYRENPTSKISVNSIPVLISKGQGGGTDGRRILIGENASDYTLMHEFGHLTRPRAMNYIYIFSLLKKIEDFKISKKDILSNIDVFLNLLEASTLLNFLYSKLSLNPQYTTHSDIGWYDVRSSSRIVPDKFIVFNLVRGIEDYKDVYVRSFKLKPKNIRDNVETYPQVFVSEVLEGMSRNITPMFLNIGNVDVENCIERIKRIIFTLSNNDSVTRLQGKPRAKLCSYVSSGIIKDSFIYYPYIDFDSIIQTFSYIKDFFKKSNVTIRNYEQKIQNFSFILNLLEDRKIDSKQSVSKNPMLENALEKDIPGIKKQWDNVEDDEVSLRQLVKKFLANNLNK